VVPNRIKNTFPCIVEEEGNVSGGTQLVYFYSCIKQLVGRACSAYGEWGVRGKKYDLRNDRELERRTRDTS
jgi:hypothetical protein